MGLDPEQSGGRGGAGLDTKWLWGGRNWGWTQSGRRREVRGVGLDPKWGRGVEWGQTQCSVRGGAGSDPKSGEGDSGISARGGWGWNRARPEVAAGASGLDKEQWEGQGAGPDTGLHLHPPPLRHS